jgi:thiol-disulfide isomerase/thioredoxin
MKTLFTLAFVFITGISAFSQDTHTTESQLKQLPSINLMDMNGKSVNTGAIGVDGPIIISFWATWCAPCKKELNTIHELYEDWQAETGVTLVAVSIDDEMVLMDPNGDFKRAMGVNNVPHTFLIDKGGNIVYSHNNYAPGDEDKLYKELLQLSGK